MVDGKIYVAGGRNQRGFTLNTLEVYNLKTAKWRVLEPMPTGRSGHAVAAVGGCLYVFGGEVNRQSGAGIFAQLEVYSAASGRWSRLPDMPIPRHRMGAASTNEVFTPPAYPG